jgi:hypothetical protein
VRETHGNLGDGDKMTTVFVCNPRVPVHWAEAAWRSDRLAEALFAENPTWYPKLFAAKSQELRVTDDLRLPCRVWTGTLLSKKNPYGMIEISKPKGRFRAHRVSFLKEIGPIGYGMTLHHLCFNKPCIEATHLTPETVGKNASFGDGRVRAEELKECVYGHPREGNITLDKNGSIICNACRKIGNQVRELLIVGTAAKLGMTQREFRRVYGKGLPQMIDILGEKDIVDLLVDRCPPENLRIVASKNGRGKRKGGQSLLTEYAETALSKITEK